MTLQFPADNPIVPADTWLCIPTPEELSTQARFFLRYEAAAPDLFEAEYTGLMAGMEARLTKEDIADFTELFFAKSPEVQQQILDLLNS